MTTMLMMGLLAAFGVFLAGGLFFVTADLLRLPYLRTSKAMVNTGRDKKTGSAFTIRMSDILFTMGVRVVFKLRSSWQSLKASSWYETLMFTTVGQIILAVTAALIFVSTALVIRLTKPLEYRR